MLGIPWWAHLCLFLAPFVGWYMFKTGRRPWVHSSYMFWGGVLLLMGGAYWVMMLVYLALTWISLAVAG